VAVRQLSSIQMAAVSSLGNRTEAQALGSFSEKITNCKYAVYPLNESWTTLQAILCRSFTDDAFRNASLPLGAGLQTNQRAELTAVLVALRRIKLNQDVKIYTDSQYTIDCVLKLWDRWRYQSWKNHQGIRRPNEDLVKQIVDIKRARDLVGASTELQWVKGHSGIPGNEAADKLAGKGAL
jgi:ribonuclease HI